jgi:predicted nucleotidyltransferase
MIDLAPEHLAIVKTILGRHLPTRRVTAFGSRVDGSSRTRSDLDLCVMGDHPLSFGQIAELQEAFSDSGLPMKVDLVDWASTGEAFRRIIERNNEVVQKGSDTSGRP